MRTASKRDGSILMKPLCLSRKSTLRIRAKCFPRVVKVARFVQEKSFVPKTQQNIKETFSVALLRLPLLLEQELLS